MIRSNSIRPGLKVPLKIYSTFKLTPKNKQKIIQEAQKDYSTWSSLERLARNLEFKNSVVQKTQK